MKLFAFFLLVIGPFYSASQQLDWAFSLPKQSGSNGKSEARGVKRTPDNGYLIWGVGSGSLDLDPGPLQTIINLGTVRNGYMVKLDANRQFLWHYRISGNPDSEFSDVDIDADGNIYIVGSTRGYTTYDFVTFYGISADPNWSAIVIKLSSSGNFIWTQAYGALNVSDYGNEITINNDTILVSGRIQQSADFDPNYTNTTFTDTYQNHFLISMDTSTQMHWYKTLPANGYQGISLERDLEGNIFWACNSSGMVLKKYAPNGNELMSVDWGPSQGDFYPEGLAIDQDGGIYITGKGENPGNYDMDPGPGFKQAGQGIFFLRLDKYGDFYLGHSIGGSEWNSAISSAYDIAIDYQKSVYISGSYRGNVDFDPSLGIASLPWSATYTIDAFVAKYDSLGNYIWAYPLTGSQYDLSKFVEVDLNLNVLNSGGFTCVTDFDPSSTGTYNLVEIGCSSSNTDSYVQQVKQNQCDHLALIIDSVSNILCNATGQVNVHGLNSIPPYTYSWDNSPFNQDSVYYPTQGGMRNVKLKSANGCIRERSFYVGYPIPAVDARVHAVSNGFIPGQSGVLTLISSNNGCVPTSGEISFVVDSLLAVDSLSVAADLVNGDTLIWFYNGATYQSPSTFIEIYYTTDTSATIGDSVFHPVVITPLNDNNPNNNIWQYVEPVQTSYDPNNKLVYPIGECGAHYIDTSQVLTYTINFQNTGTSEAINIYILDNLDDDLDLSTLEIIESSHSMITEVLGGDLLKFRFDNIFLADSASNEPESKGFIIFEIRQKPNLANITLIDNNVGIYFDYNAPIITNTVFNTVIDVVPTKSYMNTQMTVCDSITIENITYDSSGNYLLDLISSYGCDSLVAMNLTVKHSSLSQLTESVCDSFFVANQYVSATGSFQYTVQNVVGCDSLIQLDLIILNSINTIQFDTCSSITVNGIQYDSTGVYEQFFTNQAGCDSLLIVDVILHNNLNEITNVSDCDSVIVNGSSYFVSGTYLQVLSSSFGCDSILTVDATILNSSYNLLQFAACDSIHYLGQNYDQSGDYYNFYINNSGCDSIEHLEILIYPPTDTLLELSACDSLEYNGDWYYSNSNNNYYYYSNTTGCDSIVQLQVTINASDSSLQFVQGLDSVTINGQSYYSSGQYEQLLYSINGCDSLVTYDIDLDFTQLTEVDKMNFKMYPVPTDGIVHLEFDDHENAVVVVRDALGRICDIDLQYLNSEIQLDIGELAEGVYFIELKNVKLPIMSILKLK